MKRRARIVLKIILWLLLPIVWLWTLGAGYYMAGGNRSPIASYVVGGYALVTIVVLLFSRRWTIVWVAGTWVVGLVWILALQPSNDRDWTVDVARTASAEIVGDQATIRNIRNFRYRTTEDFDVDYYDKTYDLSKLDSADLVMSFWDGNTRIAHTMLSFGFGGEDYVCLSVETRKEKGEAWGGIPGFYKQFEIIYVLGDERDLINLRTSYRKEDVYLYRLLVPRNEVRQYFEHALARIDKLSREPEFYDTLEYNCSSALTLMAADLWPDRPRARGIASLLNGATAENAHRAGRISNELPFVELKKRSYVTPIGQEHRDAEDFSQRLRANLP